MKKYRYTINNLSCAACAKKLESKLNKETDFNNVVVNFSTSKVSYESDKEIGLKELNKIIKKFEPNAYVGKNKKREQKEYHISILIIGSILGIIGLFIKLPSNINFILVLISYVLLLYSPFVNTVKTLVRSKTINENALITISCVGAYLVNQKMEGLMVVFLYLVGKILEEKAINKTRESVSDLLNIKQDYANKKVNNGIVQIDVEEIKVGDILVVKKGEKIPVDGIVIKGSTKLDTSALTGESELVEVQKNNKVLSSSINMDDVIEMKVTSTYENSTVSQILELVEDAADKKANTETFVSKASVIYTPVVLFLAVLVGGLLPLFTNVTYSESIYRGLTFLVIACPCAIAISVPLSYFTGIGVSSKNGILFKGSNYLDNLGQINKIIFDKTGTLTTGNFKVTDIKITDDNYSKEEVIRILTKGESLSNHPIAKSIVKLTDKKINNKDIKNYKEIEGKGISFELDNKKVFIGEKDFECNIDARVHLHIDRKHIASISIDDGIKDDAFETIEAFKNLNIKTYMFTGDKKENALEIGNRLGIDEIKYEMLPTDKYSEYEKIAKNEKNIAFVGDGINDAPILKRADIGVSMGGIGSSSAIEASDVVIMNDDLIKIPKAINISKYTNGIIKQNLIFAIGIKISVLLLSVFGIATMWFAVFADTGVTLLTILNTLRIMKKFN